MLWTVYVFFPDGTLAYSSEPFDLQTAEGVAGHWYNRVDSAGQRKYKVYLAIEYPTPFMCINTNPV